MELVEYRCIDGLAYEEYMREWEAEGTPIVPGASDRRGRSFCQMLERWAYDETDEPFKKGFVPSMLYFLVGDGHRILGAIHLRKCLNESLRLHGGHIGYGIRPTERGKGYASLMLGLLLDLIGASVSDEYLLTCDESNLASQRTIEGNGGILEESLEHEGVRTRKYRIKARQPRGREPDNSSRRHFMETGARQIRKVRAVREPIAQVWERWASHEGLKTFFGRDNSFELRLGGPFEIYFLMDNPKGLRGSEGCKILSFLPERMLSFSWNAPPAFQEIRESEHKTWVVLLFRELGGRGTEVSLSHLGWPTGAAWEAVYSYFDEAWDEVLDNLEEACTREAR